MKNIIQKIANKAGKGLLTLLVPFIIGGCAEKEFGGKIIKESFYASAFFGVPDNKYTASIETPEGKIIEVKYSGEKALKMNLEYDVEDEVIFEDEGILGKHDYKIVRKKAK